MGRPSPAPAIRLNYLSYEVDQRVPLATVLPPLAGCDDDAALLQGIRQNLELVHHPAGSCRMGTGPDAVVDPALRVHGIDGLRVADASIMPTLISGNTHAASVMIGEKVAELVASLTEY